MPSKSFSRVTRNKESRKDGKRVITSNVCGILGDIASDCRKKEGASCNSCQQKEHLDTACREKGNRSFSGGTNHSLPWISAVSENFEVYKNEFVIDSGSTDHIVFLKKTVCGFSQKNDVVLSPIGGQSQINGVGKVLIQVFNEKRQKVGLQLEDVLYVSLQKFNLLSLDKVLEMGHSVLFKDKKASLKITNSNNFFLLKRRYRLFLFKTQFPNNKSVFKLVKVDES